MNIIITHIPKERDDKISDFSFNENSLMNEEEKHNNYF